MAEPDTSRAVFLAPIPTGDVITLTGDEGHHAVRVRRIRAGEQIRIIDGAGQYADAEVTEVGGAGLTARIIERGSSPQPHPRIDVAQALPKGDRAALAVEVLTEIGVDGIIPWQAARSVSRWSGPDKMTRGVQKWQRVAIEAAKQSRRLHIPTVAEPVDIAGLTAQIGQRQCIVLHESALHPLTALELRPDADILLVVGPEGGIAPEELAALDEAGAHIVRLGRQVLRTSTAGVAATSWLCAQLGRWS